MAEPELEEGEACCHKDDTSIDPDIALSYILQNVLGHFQKDFEGGVCAENLGFTGIDDPYEPPLNCEVIRLYKDKEHAEVEFTVLETD